MEFDVETIARALVNIYKQQVDIDHDIEQNLYRDTLRIMGDAMDNGFAQAAEDGVSVPDQAFRDAFTHSAEVFSAFRVHKMQNDIAAQMLDSDGNVKPFSRFVKDVSPYIEHRNRAWLRTEYDTAIIRARNAAEWQQFQDEKDVYPNLEWIPSTSPNPGADHRVFWGTVLPVDDPFWDEHKPGDRWNCKCELRQTDKGCTAAPSSDGKSDAAPGLESNPAKSKEVFSDNHPYFPSSCSTCPFAGNKLMALAHDLVGNGTHCMNCRSVDGVIESASDLPTDHVELYKYLKKHGEYIDVKYDKKTGGVKATHIGHNEHAMEEQCRDKLFKLGHSAILCDESKAVNGQTLTALDIILDGKRMDIASVTSASTNIGYKLKSKQEQINRFEHRTDIPRDEVHDSVCIYIPDKSFYHPEMLDEYFRFYREWVYPNAGPINPTIRDAYFVVEGIDEIIIHHPI